MSRLLGGSSTDTAASDVQQLGGAAPFSQPPHLPCTSLTNNDEALAACLAANAHQTVGNGSWNGARGGRKGRLSGG